MKPHKLIAMTVLSFLAMYILMYVMVDRYGNVYASLDQFYMAGLMTSAMLLIEMAVMKSMYERKVKLAVTGLSVLAFLIFFVCIRTQAAVSDREFLKSMISHHGSALLMCQNTDLKDPEVKELCGSIISGQQSEIDWMKMKLSALK